MIDSLDAALGTKLCSGRESVDGLVYDEEVRLTVRKRRMLL
jgi:hypothetical protein